MGKYTSEDSSDSSSEEELRSKKSSKKKHSSSHKKKKSKDKKYKKKSKKQRHRSSTEESSGSEDEWVVKSSGTPAEKPVPISADSKPDSEFKTPSVEIKKVESVTNKDGDDDTEWRDFGSSFSTFSNDSKRSDRKKRKEDEREARDMDSNIGKHANELNPYWKDGGKGLPSELTGSKGSGSNSKDLQTVGDGGLNYLRKAYIRAKEQAQEEGRNIEDVISERWGSLESFMSKLEEAERKSGKLSNNDTGCSRNDNRKRFQRPANDSDSGDDYDRASDSRSRRHHHKSHKRHKSHRSRERSPSRSQGWRKEGHSITPPPSNKEPSRRDEKISHDSTRTAQTSSTSNFKPSFSSFEVSRPRSSNSSSPNPLPDDRETEEEEKTQKINVLTDKEMNELNAKLMKAEMLGNSALVTELKHKIAEAETARQIYIKDGGVISQNQNKSTKVVTKVIMDTRKPGRRKDKVTETHSDGQRVRYFPDDDKQTLKNMFQKEKMNTAADENAMFARLAAKGAKTGVDYDIDDVFTDKASSSKQAAKEEERAIKEVLEEEKHYKRVLDNCQWCFDGTAAEKHLILSVAEKSYLCVPPYQSLTEGHCLIVPMCHAASSTDLDEDVWAEMQKFKKTLVRMFKELDQDMVIFETAMHFNRHPHMYLECIPMPKETGELAPIYFKKAIQECETEWSQNKKLVDLRNRDVRKAVPKGLPYFFVDFGDDNCGFAHVVEDERNFSRNFAHEIVGGMMELDHHLWRKQRKDDFKTQRTKVMEFLKHWGPFDWTRDVAS